MDPQRCHPARANPAQPGLQRRALHGGWAGSSSAAGTWGTCCESMSATAALVLRPISRAASSASSTRLRRRSGARSGWGWASPSWSASPPCWNTPSPLLRRSGKVRASRSWYRGCRRLPRIASAVPGATPADRLRDKLIVVIDDDALALEGTGGLLRSWGCRVVTGQSDREALTKLNGSRPDLIISDYHLKEGRSGIDAISELRDAFGAQDPGIPDQR